YIACSDALPRHPRPRRLSSWNFLWCDRPNLNENAFRRPIEESPHRPRETLIRRLHDTQELYASDKRRPFDARGRRAERYRRPRVAAGYSHAVGPDRPRCGHRSLLELRSTARSGDLLPAVPAPALVSRRLADPEGRLAARQGRNPRAFARPRLFHRARHRLLH